LKPWKKKTSSVLRELGPREVEKELFGPGTRVKVVIRYRKQETVTKREKKERSRWMRGESDTTREKDTQNAFHLFKIKTMMGPTT